MTTKQRLVIGISGASGIVYGIRLLEMLRSLEIETHVVITKMADRARACETQLSAQQLRELADVCYPIADLGASIASGSFQTLGMIVAPCSMKTLAEIAHGFSSNLLARAADVTLKERRRLVLMVRETPFHLGHLRNMVTATELGAIVAPPIPAFYHQPKSIEDIINQNVARVLDLFGLESDLIKRWGETIYE